MSDLSVNPLEGMQSEYHRFKYLESSSKFIKAEKVEIGRVREDKRKNGSVLLDHRWCYVQYSPHT